MLFYKSKKIYANDYESLAIFLLRIRDDLATILYLRAKDEVIQKLTFHDNNSHEKLTSQRIPRKNTFAACAPIMI